MTKKLRYPISAAVLAACVCIAMVVLAMMPPRPGVTKSNFDRIEMGMTLGEVKEIFGEEGWIFDGGTPVTPSSPRHWRVNGMSITVEFSDEAVSDKHIFIETISGKLRRWLGLAE